MFKLYKNNYYGIHYSPSYDDLQNTQTLLNVVLHATAIVAFIERNDTLPCQDLLLKSIIFL